MTQSRLLIVDPYPLFRLGARAALASAPEFTVMGEAATAGEALGLLQRGRPDLLLVSTLLPDGSGWELGRRAKERVPATALVLLAPEDNDEERFRAMQVGAAALLARDVAPAHLLASLRRAVAGESLLAEDAVARPGVATRVLRQFRDQAELAPNLKPLLVPLSAREIEILEQIARGNSNKVIARELAISDHTVKNHVTSILRKLAVNDRTGAVVYALRQGWIQT